MTDTSGADIAMPDEVRVYTVSGVSHAPFRPLTKPVMQLPGNRLGYGAFMRALLVRSSTGSSAALRRRTAGFLRAPPAPTTTCMRTIRDVLALRHRRSPSRGTSWPPAEEQWLTLEMLREEIDDVERKA